MQFPAHGNFFTSTLGGAAFYSRMLGKAGQNWRKWRQSSKLVIMTSTIDESFAADLLLNLPVKEFCKSVNILWSYEQDFSGFLFWLAGYIQTYRQTCRRAHRNTSHPIGGKVILGPSTIWKAWSCRFQILHERGGGRSHATSVYMLPIYGTGLS